MWPFKKTMGDEMIAVMDDAIDLAAEKWKSFCAESHFKVEVPLEKRVFMFLAPMTERLKNTYPAFSEQTPPAIFLIVVAKGIERSGTHTTAELEVALGVPMP